MKLSPLRRPGGVPMKVLKSATDNLTKPRPSTDPAKDDAASKPRVDELKKLDTNKDGKLDRTEFSKSSRFQSADERQREALNRAYDSAANAAGQIDTDASFEALASMLDEATATVPASEPEVGGIEAAYNAVKGFFGDIFGKMKKAASDFVSWAGDQLNKFTNGFFDQFETEVVRRSDAPDATAARKRLRETDADEKKALDKLSPQDRDAYKAVASQIDSDPDTRLLLRELLLDGRLPGGNDLADGKSLLANLSSLAQQPLADGIDRKELLADVLAHVEDPITIAQKQQNTCGPTTGQLMLARQEPAEYVRIAAGLASPDGKVTLQNGDTIQREDDWNARTDDNRTLGNRLLQTSLMEYANGKFDYDNINDTRKVNLGVTSVDIPGLLPNEMVKLAEALTGSKHDIDYSLMSDRVSSDFQKALDQAGPGSEIPVLINYNVDASGVSSTSPHYVLVTGYDAESGMVSVSNPWGREEKVALSELQKHLIAAMPPAA